MKLEGKKICANSEDNKEQCGPGQGEGSHLEHVATKMEDRLRYESEGQGLT